MRWLGAPIVVAVAACGGAVPDTAVTVRVLTVAGAPIEGAALFFSGADGRLFAFEHTDRDGEAEGPLEPGGMVTRYEGFGAGAHRLVTDLGVSLDGGAHQIVVPSPPTAGHAVHVDTPRAPAGASRVLLWGDCDDTAIEVPFRKAVLLSASSCAPHGIHVLAYALDDDGRPRAFSLAQRGPGEVDRIVLPAWSSFTRTTTLSLTHLPTGVSRAHASIAPSLRGHAFGRHGKTFPSGPAPRLSFGLPPDFGDEILVTVVAELSDRLALTQWVTSSTVRALEADGDVMFLPPVSAVVLEPDEQRLSWTPAPELARADVVEAELTWARGHWYFRGRPGPTTLSVPELPSALEIDRSGPQAAAVAYHDFAAYADLADLVGASAAATREVRSSYGFTPTE